MTNHGGPREGAGRKHVDGTPAQQEPKDPAKMVNVRLTGSMIEHAAQVGSGNISEGIRIIIRRDMDR